MEYQPEYAKGQILVHFKRPYSDAFIREFGETLGYTLLDNEERAGHVFKTEPGKEEEALNKFKSFSDFVEWTDYRDIKMESRWESLEEAIDLLQQLHDNVEIPDNEYNTKLREIQDYLQKIQS